MHATECTDAFKDFLRWSRNMDVIEEARSAVHPRSGTRVMYEQVKERILEDVRAGRLLPGVKLPSERQLCQVYSVSRVTIRRAIRDLVSAGVLESVSGKGTYVRDPGPARGKTGCIAFVRCTRGSKPSSITSDVFYPAILAGLEESAAIQGYHCVVHTVDETHPDVDRLHRLAERVDGIACAELRKPELLEELKRLGLPLVLVSPSLSPPDVDVVEIDNAGGADQGVRWLLQLGHRRIGFIRGSPGSRPGNERESGFRRALQQAGIPVDDTMIAGSGWRYEDGYSAMLELLKKLPRLTAVFAASDLLALGAYQAIRESGLEVGQDVSVLGFDNIDIAAQSVPPLTTVSVRRREIGQMAARLLFEALRGDRDYPVRVVLPTVLVERASTATAARDFASVRLDLDRARSAR